MENHENKCIMSWQQIDSEWPYVVSVGVCMSNCMAFAQAFHWLAWRAWRLRRLRRLRTVSVCVCGWLEGLEAQHKKQKYFWASDTERSKMQAKSKWQNES